MDSTGATDLRSAAPPRREARREQRGPRGRGAGERGAADRGAALPRAGRAGRVRRRPGVARGESRQRGGGADARPICRELRSDRRPRRRHGACGARPAPEAPVAEPVARLALEETLHLWLADANPACGPLRGLFDPKELDGTRYGDIVDGLGGYFAGQPPFGPDNEDLVTLLRSPAVAFPNSLKDQLEYIRRKFGALLGELLAGLLVGLDLLREQERLGAGAPGPAVAGVPTYDDARAEIEAFSADRDWMPRVVMIAKNTLVWLDQLSRTLRPRPSAGSTRCPTRSWTRWPGGGSPPCG